MRNTLRAGIILFLCALIGSCSGGGSYDPGDTTVGESAPLCGIVLWGSNPDMDAYGPSVNLEFSYFYYSDVADDDGAGGYSYDWSAVDAFIETAVARGHHAIVRFRDTDPELGSTDRSLPASLWLNARNAKYDEGIEGATRKTVFFPDWTNSNLADFIIDFYGELARRYPDQSTGLGYVEVGFGLWAEYHIDYDNLSDFSDSLTAVRDGARGRLFPSRTDQVRILEAIDGALVNIPWGISVDAADTGFGPYESTPPSSAPRFGLFDDSLLHAGWNTENRPNWDFFGDRRAAAHNGGEFSYYTELDQRNALRLPGGPNGYGLDAAARECSLSFVIGDGQTDYRTPAEIASAGALLGYRLEILSLTRESDRSTIRVRNDGAAAVTYDVYAACGDIISAESLKGLLPGSERNLVVISPDASFENLAFDSPVLLSGQRIPFTVR